MNRAILYACWPWLALLIVSIAAVCLLVRLSGARAQFARLRQLHRNETGAVQSLSFVLTLPVFVIFMLFIVQMSQLTIATVVVHYAAYAAARSASVWISAQVQGAQGENSFSPYQVDADAKDQVFPVLNPQDEQYGPADGGVTYLADQGGWKYEKIRWAAVMACMPISPSRDLGQSVPPGTTGADALKAAYQGIAPKSQGNPKIPVRLDNKLAYALNNTKIDIRFFHKNREPPLATYYLPHDIAEFRYDEIGWQDLITVTVKYDLALLPGPGRLLARHVVGPGGSADKVADTIKNKGNHYAYPLEASATMGNEGEKSVMPWAYEAE